MPLISLRIRIIVLLFLAPILYAAGQTPVRLTDSVRVIALHKEPWLFHTGDNPLWANTAVDDRQWQRIHTNFGRDSLPKGWTGFGWFRIKVKKDTQAGCTTWGIHLNQDGAAELFLDGVHIGTIGRIGHSRETMRADRAPFTVFPVAITDTLPHVLAVRFSNYNAYFPDFIGFQLWMGDMHQLNTKYLTLKSDNDKLLLSVVAQFTLVILHLLLFIFYPGQKINLYYSLFVTNMASALYLKFLNVDTADPFIQMGAQQLFLSVLSVAPLTGALLLYAISSETLPKGRVKVLTIICTVFLILSIVFGTYEYEAEANVFWIIVNIAIILAYLDGIWHVVQAARRGNPVRWLIAAGMLVVGILTAVLGGNILGWFSSYQTIINGMAITTLIMPVLFSVYIALDFAGINKSLSRQLTENQLLAEQNLEQQREKYRLIADQAERLEQTVAERTAQVRAQAEKLREMDAVKSRFFVNLTHEFKTPLTLIINPAKELLQTAGSAPVRQHARFILQNGERLLQLINQLLDLSRLENGQPDIVYQPLELVRWLRTHWQQYHSLTSQKAIRTGFTSTMPVLWVMADADKLEKIVQNLIANAIKFSNPQGTIAVHLETGDQTFSIRISDQGIGIPEEKLPHIFDRFYQADATDTRTREGAGIGLALTKELTELLGGHISVDSEEGKGTVFAVTLPLVAAPENSPVAMPEESPDTGDRQTADEANDLPDEDETMPLILLAEDNADLRDFISLSLSGSYRVITAADGLEGIRMAFEKIPSLVITDLMMPQKDGYEVCHTVKTDERTSHIPVVMLTAKSDQDSRVRGIRSGADAYLAKPFDKQELTALIDNLILTRKQLREKFGKTTIWLEAADQLPSIEQVFLSKVRAAIDTHIADDQYSSEQLAADMALSRTQLHRKLKQLINQSPGELIRLIRMQRAHELLQHHAATVAEVCYMTGYTNPANFSTTFSRHFGYPPSEAAKRHSEA